MNLLRTTHQNVRCLVLGFKLMPLKMHYKVLKLLLLQFSRIMLSVFLSKTAEDPKEKTEWVLYCSLNSAQ